MVLAFPGRIGSSFPCKREVCSSISNSECPKRELSEFFLRPDLLATLKGLVSPAELHSLRVFPSALLTSLTHIMSHTLKHPALDQAISSSLESRAAEGLNRVNPRSHHHQGGARPAPQQTCPCSLSPFHGWCYEHHCVTALPALLSVGALVSPLKDW